MAFTKIVSPGIDTTGSYTVRDLNAVGVVTASAFSGPLTGNAAGLTGTPDITVGAITAASADFSGNVSIAGTLTYEDVTNIDSVGLITARNGLHVTSGNVAIGLNNPSAPLHLSGPAEIRLNNAADAGNFARIRCFEESSDNGAHLTFAVGTGEALRIQNDGNIGIGTDNPTSPLHLQSTSANQNVLRISANNGRAAYIRSPQVSDSNTPFTFYTNNAWRFDIDSIRVLTMTHDYKVGIRTDNPEEDLSIQLDSSSDGPTLRLRNANGGDGTYTGRISTGDAYGTFLAGINFLKHDSNDGEIRFRTKVAGTNTDVVTIVDGEVGIGTDNPYSKNHIEINAAAGAGSGSAGALWLKNANQTANNSATIFFGNNVSQAAGAINFIHKDYSTNAGDITFDTRTNGSTYAERLRIKSDGVIKFGANNTDYLEWGNNPRLVLQAPTGLNGLRVYSDTTPLEVAGSATTRKISMGGNPNYDLSISGSYSLSSGGHDSSPKVFLNATRHNGSTTVTSFQTSIQAVSASNTANDGYLGLGASATPDDLVIRPSGNIGAQNTDPKGKIHIGGAISDDANDADTTNTSLIIKQSTNTREDGIYIERSGERKGYYMWMNPGGGSGDGLTFSRNNGGSYSNALILDRDANLWGGGTFYPLLDNSYDLGSPSNRWRNVYTTDLQLSNEGSQNDVDGTWGSYTIQEGEDELFLINRRNGKKYKFNLTEVN